MGKFFKFAKDSSYIKDFLAGAEPTGVYTFQNAAKNTKNHGKHRTVGNIGGFVGGFASSVALGALGTAGLGLALKKKNPQTGKAMRQAASDMLQVFNPKSYGSIKRLPQSSQVMNSASAAMKNIETLQQAHKGSQGINVKQVADTGKSIFDTLKKQRDFKTKFGVDPTSDVRRGFGMSAALVTGGLGGGLNALSAHTQYGSGKTIGKKLQEVEAKKKK